MKDFMELAIQEAKKAKDRGSVPVGAVIVLDKVVISSAGNEVIKNLDPTAHAEVLAIRTACATLGSHIIDRCDIYVTLEPCTMCMQAIYLSRIRRLYFGAYNAKCFSTEGSIFSKDVLEIVGGILETPCAKILQNFFQTKRN